MPQASVFSVSKVLKSEREGGAKLDGRKGRAPSHPPSQIGRFTEFHSRSGPANIGRLYFEHEWFHYTDHCNTGFYDIDYKSSGGTGMDGTHGSSKRPLTAIVAAKLHVGKQFAYSRSSGVPDIRARDNPRSSGGAACCLLDVRRDSESFVGRAN
ncbi:hypothetical protein SISSUDRAFT_87619 [Sistotremastrum suecicum HHB10207 ss-3]|uniref:Uncharacterized protein n=1 Tax=Sistotremastrum suecicum HHB10207 ss-3 TaxID=1314776 RepID=A0A166BBK8_9AGAM|nr:hypothetical protein SISSUDRAFT_87619 [Sistotremastrum suecicum HHB10207 ss-3]